MSLRENATVDNFSEFFRRHETRLRQSLTPSLGIELAREAAAEAMAYGWENWSRVSQMENPIGYLYKVGKGKGRRMRVRRGTPLMSVPDTRIPDVEPALPEALNRLSERQRTVVVLVHCYQWTYSEVAETLALTRSTVQTHVERAMSSLRRDLGGTA